MPHVVICHIGGFQGYVHVTKEIIAFVYLECSFINEIMLLMFLVKKVIFVWIPGKSCQRLELWNTMDMLLVFGMEVTCAEYNVKNYGKHEILLLDTCLLYL